MYLTRIIHFYIKHDDGPLGTKKTCSWLLTNFCHTVNIVVLMVILLHKKMQKTQMRSLLKKTYMSAFVKKCTFIAQQWEDKQMCEKESTNCLICSYRTIHIFTTTPVPSTVCTHHKHIPIYKAISMKMDVYFEI